MRQWLSLFHFFNVQVRLCLMAITFELSKKAKLDISVFKGQPHIGCTPWSPNPPASPGLAISPSWVNTTYMICLHFTLSSSETVRILTVCSEQCGRTVLLWLTVSLAPCLVRGYQQEQRWPGLIQNVWKSIFSFLSQWETQTMNHRPCTHIGCNNYSYISVHQYGQCWMKHSRNSFSYIV